MSYTELSRSYPIGRKNYRCEWCNEVIKIKEKHFKRVFLVDNDFNDGRMHLECEKSMMTYPHEDDLRDGWMPGDFNRGEVWTSLKNI